MVLPDENRNLKQRNSRDRRGQPCRRLGLGFFPCQWCAAPAPPLGSAQRSPTILLFRARFRHPDRQERRQLTILLLHPPGEMRQSVRIMKQCLENCGCRKARGPVASHRQTRSFRRCAPRLSPRWKRTIHTLQALTAEAITSCPARSTPRSSAQGRVRRLPGWRTAPNRLQKCNDPGTAVVSPSCRRWFLSRGHCWPMISQQRSSARSTSCSGRCDR